MCPLVLSNSSGSTGAGCHGTDVADASPVRCSPIALLLGVLARVRRDEVSLLLVAPFWPGRVWFSDLISLLDGSPWEIPVSRDLLSQAGVFTPARRCGSCGGGPWGGTTHSFRSLNRGCWDHPPIQSSLNEETVHFEVETFTSWCGDRQLDPVNCPIGTVLEFLQALTLCRVGPLHLEGSRGGNSAYHTSLGGQSMGRHPLVTRFLHSMRKLYALKWKCHFMVRRLPARPSQPIGTVLEFVQACSSTGLTHSTLKVTWRQFGLPHLSWWAISGHTPPGYTFPPQLCVW